MEGNTSDGYWVECQGCGVETTVMFTENHAGIIWNQRTLPSAERDISIPPSDAEFSEIVAAYASLNEADYPVSTEAKGFSAFNDVVRACIRMAKSNQSATIPSEATPEMIAAVGTILQPYAAKLVWKRMMEVASTGTKHGA